MSPPVGAKKWWGLLLEASGSLLLVLAVFSLFIGLLYVLFPSATPLREMVSGGPDEGKYPWRQVEARLSSLQNDVRFRRGNSIAWGGASEGLPLYSQDAVQTLDGSGAKISFGPKDVLTLGSNSLVVVTRVNPAEESAQRSYHVEVDGELRGNLSADRKVQMEFDAAGHVARFTPGAARFRVSPNGQGSSSLSVYSGEAQVAGKDGPIRIPANHGVALRRGAAVGRVLRIPGAPTVRGGEGVYRYRRLPPRLTFAWSAPAGEYHLQVASDPGFRKCLIDEKLRLQEYATGQLAKGRYYWRVSRLTEGLEGAFSRVARLQLQQVLDAPRLKVEFPRQEAAPGPYLLTGSCDPASRVFVDGAEVARKTPERFECELRLKPGVNLIRVEAVDATGNASYASRIVYAKEGRNGTGEAGSRDGDRR